MKNWDDKYLLNISTIDEQHQGFFMLLEEELIRHENPSKEQMVGLIEKLDKYLRNHFDAEENLLKDAGYTDIKAHKQQHTFFINKVNEMKLDLSYNNQLTYNKLIDFMKKWFLSHIMHSDREYQKIILNYLQKEGSE